MNRAKKSLNNNLLILDPLLRKVLIKIYLQTISISKMDLLGIIGNVPRELEELTDDVNVRIKSKKNEINREESIIKKLVLESCDKSFKAFCKEYCLGDDDSEGDDPESKTLFIDNKPMPHVQKARYRTHFKYLTKFIKLVDFWVFNAKLNLSN